MGPLSVGSWCELHTIQTSGWAGVETRAFGVDTFGEARKSR